MCIWNKVLVGLISVASVVFFYMAARTLQTHKYWAELARKHEQRIEKLQKENHMLAEGEARADGTTQEGIRQVRTDLHRLLVDRGRVWFQCDPKVKIGREDGSAEVTAAIEQPAPHGIAPQTVLYAFEEADAQQKGRYLGEFVVTKTGDKQVTFVPTGRLNTRELDRLQAAKRPWKLYDELPRDNHEVFASWTDEQKKEVLPAGFAAEYLQDGKPAPEGTPADRLADGKYVRPLYDFGVLLSAERGHRILLGDSIEAVTRDKKLVEDALAEARRQEEACQKHIVATKADLKEAGRQRDIVAVYRKQLEEKLGAMQAWVSRLIESNQAMAGQMAKLQLEAAERIDQRTRAMAQSGTGRP